MTRESADEAISRIKSIYCKDCDNYGGVRCRACDFDCVMSDIDDLADPNRRVITFHPYPEEKPPVGEDVLIQWDDGSMEIGWSSNDDWGFPEPFGKVVAWAELPKPYVKADET